MLVRQSSCELHDAVRTMLSQRRFGDLQLRRYAISHQNRLQETCALLQERDHGIIDVRRQRSRPQRGHRHQQQPMCDRRAKTRRSGVLGVVMQRMCIRGHLCEQAKADLVQRMHPPAKSLAGSEILEEILLSHHERSPYLPYALRLPPSAFLLRGYLIPLPSDQAPSAASGFHCPLRMRVIVTLVNMPAFVNGSPSTKAWASARLPTLTTNRLPTNCLPSSLVVAPESTSMSFRLRR